MPLKLIQQEAHLSLYCWPGFKSNLVFEKKFFLHKFNYDQQLDINSYYSLNIKY